jgi:hypothetical protein
MVKTAALFVIILLNTVLLAISPATATGHCSPDRPIADIKTGSKKVNHTRNIVVYSLSKDRDARTSGHNETETLIAQAPDAAIDGSAVSFFQNIFSVIAILHLWHAAGDFLADVIPGQRDFLKILFRVIIAPNAP